MFTHQSFREITHNQGRKDQLLAVGFACTVVCFDSHREVDHRSQSRAFSRGELASPQRHLHAVLFSPQLLHDFPFAAFCCICAGTDSVVAGLLELKG